MLNCLSKIFTQEGLLTLTDGLRVNKPGILYLPDCGGLREPGFLGFLVNLTARLGVELAGMQLPVSGSRREDAIALEVSASVPPGICRLELREGGLSVTAAKVPDLELGVQYLTCCYPYDRNGSTIEECREELGADYIREIDIDCKALQVKRLAWSTGIQRGEQRYERELAEEKGSASSYRAAAHHFHENTDVRILTDYSAEDGGGPDPETVLIIALRFALENFRTVWPYGVKIPQEGKKNISFVWGRLRKAVARKTAQGMEFSGGIRELRDFARLFAAQEADPFAHGYLEDVSAILSGSNELGQVLQAAAAYGGQKPWAGRLVTREYARGMVDRGRLSDFVKRELGKHVELCNFNDEKEVLRQKYTCAWEGRDFLDVFEKEVLPQLGSSDRIQIYGVLSEDLDVRRQLSAAVSKMAGDAGAKVTHVELYRSFKSGCSWISEGVLPGLLERGKENIGSVAIRFPYLVNGLGEEVFEDESTPSYGVHLDKPEKYFDIPTRWLQELFPVDEIIAGELSLDLERIHFVRDDQLPCTYRFEAFDHQERLLFTQDFDVKYVQKDYIKKYPQIGKTHVTTGWIHVARGEEVLLSRRIVTDPEKVWAVLEDQLLPQLETYLTGKYGLENLLVAQPLFNRLQLNVSMSEMDFDLGIRQERISTAEAMQEDLYFYLLDWFKTFGERECGRELDNVGLIMPVPVIRKGQDTEFEMILSEDLTDGLQLRFSGERGEQKTGALEEQPVSLAAKSVWFEEDALHIRAEATLSGRDTLAVRRAELLAGLIAEGVLELYSWEPVVLELDFGAQGLQRIFIPQARAPRPKITAEQKDRILRKDVVDYPQYLNLLEYYRQFPQVRIVPMETTYKGRKIFSMEFTRRSTGVFYGAVKLKNERISAGFTARHHGNEASSLNSAFMLADELLFGRLSQTLDRINVVLVPFINIDGGMLHCQVQRDHPKWLCHPARYNSAGYEFRKDFEKPDSRYGEARLLGKLWKEWLFDVITDNHGFEGHELCQPFSGYISPWYKSFWIPRALYYGYIWYRSGQPHTIRIGQAIMDRVAEAINGDAEICGLNGIFAERFHKYAQCWFPEMFTLEQYKDVVFYSVDTSVKPRAANYGVRNPEITALDWTTEVADETAVGEYMYTNARAHLLSDLAVFRVMEECALETDTSVMAEVTTEVTTEAGGSVYTRFRRRPLFCGPER